MSWFFTVAIFFFVIVLTAMIFFGWVAVMVIGLLIRGMMALFAPGAGGACDVRARGASGPSPGAASHTVRCPTRGCHAINPATARFCRRCGRGLPAAQRVQVRRAAVW
jgi:hypothetical protein